MEDWDEPHLERVRSGLLSWFAIYRRDLPWRDTRDPYAILVSEVMLQQTQVDRVIPYYARWLEAFPNVQALASASTADVIRIWSGLGYNRRAVYLQKTARAVADDYGGVFPSTPEAQRKLPGIGPYTAGAIAAFAFERDVAFLDTNMRRVVHRLLIGSDVPARRATERELLAAAERLVGAGTGWLWNQALIEFGALQCTQRRPTCVVCPLSGDCAAFPVIQSELAAMPPGMRLKNEGAFDGSNRQFRGRIVEELRRAQKVTLTELGHRLKPDFGEADREWLRGLVNGLAGDGLLAIREPESEYRTDDPAADPVVSLPD